MEVKMEVLEREGMPGNLLCSCCLEIITKRAVQIKAALNEGRLWLCKKCVLQALTSLEKGEEDELWSV